VIVSVATVLINAALNTWLVGILGYQGLALGTSIAALFNAMVLTTLLRRRMGGLEGGRVVATLSRILVASALMGVAATAMDGWLEQVMPGSALLPQLIRLIASMGTAVGVLAAAAYALRVREFHEAMTLVARKLRPGTR
jgi:putative peptidoglycan lipid II flippase